MGGVELILGDCLQVMRGLEAGSVDAIIADPPAGISFMSLDFDKSRGGRAQWVAWLAERLAEARRVIKPGHYALIWSIPRTSHWTGCAIEDAGWQPIDIISQIFGQGFPKSKARLKPAVEFWWLCRAPGGGKVRELGIDQCRVGFASQQDRSAATPQGRCTSKTSSTGLGATPDIDRETTRVEFSRPDNSAGRYPPHLCLLHHPDCTPAGTRRVKGSNPPGKPSRNQTRNHGACYADIGANPAYIDYADSDGTEEVAAYRCHESCPVRLLDEMAGERTSGKGYPGQGSGELVTSNTYGSSRRSAISTCYADSGSNVSRFFPQFAFEATDFAPFSYFSKASKSDRGPDNHHPTVKSTQLMMWLSKLVCPPGGTILDPFLGSGSTGVAAVREGFGFVGIEEVPEYLDIARRRIDGERSKMPLLGGTS